MIALLDLDGTVADMDGALRRELEKLSHPEEPLPPEHGQPIPRWLEARRDLVQRQPGFWRNLERLPLGFEIVEELRRQDFQIMVLSKGPSSKPQAWAEKLEWARTHLPDAMITLTEAKEHSYGRVLVDDWPSYYMKWLAVRPRGLVVVPAQPWNKGCEATHPNILRYSGSKEDQGRLRVALQRARTRANGEALDLKERFASDFRTVLGLADARLHKLWTAAVGTPTYDKEMWKARERALWACVSIPQIEEVLKTWGTSLEEGV